MSSTVLIADGKESRAQRVAEACVARGFDAQRASNGALALEMALADVPEILVCTAELALIDGGRLAEILRANPRTQDVRIVFVGRDAGAASGLYDGILPGSSRPDEIAVRVESLVARRARIDAVGRQASGDHEVQGNLSQIPLPDLLQLFHMNRRTGTVELTRSEPGGRQDHGEVVLRDGNVIQAKVSPKVEGEKALYRMLTWPEGGFSFSPHTVNGVPRILTPTRALLMEGMRQLDEWERIRGSMPPLMAHVTLAVPRSELPNAVHPVTQEVLLLLEIYDRVRDILDHCTHSDYQVLRTLKTLIERGLVQVRRRPDRLDPTGAQLFEPAQQRRLRDWLEEQRPRGVPPADAKLLLASPDPDAVCDFVQLLAGLPGMELSPPYERQGCQPEDVMSIGRLAVGQGIGLELIHVPAGRRMAPVWPVLAYGALGTLLLASAPLAEALGQTRPLAEALSRLPGARIFHVLLLRKGERVAPDELQDKVSLLDRSSLFLLQTESGKDPVALLRTMLARVFP